MNSSLRQKLATTTLLACTFSFFILTGGGTYEMLTVSRIVASAPPQSLAMLQGPYGFNPVVFWILFHPLTELLLILAVIFNWKVSRYRRKMLLIASALIILIRVATALYFAPEVGEIAGAQFAPGIDSSQLVRAQLWVKLNFVRLAAYYVTGIVLLLAVRKTEIDDRV